MIVYILFRIFLALFNLLPRRAAICIGTVVGEIWYLLDGRHRRVAKANLTAVFGDEKEYREICRIARATFRQIAVNIADLCRIEKITSSGDQKLFTFEGLDKLQNALDRGKGVVALLSHFGNWELVALGPCALKSKATVVAKPLRNKWIERHIVNMRRRLYLEPVPKRHVARELIRVLKKGQIAGIMTDQAAGRDGEWIDFMGCKASTITSPALFALKTGAAVISGFIERDSNHLYRVIYDGPHELISTGDTRRDVIANTESFNKILEARVRKKPDHWFWVHRRWKLIPAPNIAPEFRQARNILLCMPNWIGDIVMAIPALNYLRNLFPQSRITVLIRENLADMVSDQPAVDEVIAYRYQRGLKGQAMNLKTIISIRRRFFDLAVVLPDSFRAALWMYLAGIPLRVGHSYEGRGLLLNHRIKKKRWEVSQVDRYLELLKLLGTAEADPVPKLVASKHERQWAEELLKREHINSDTLLIGLNPAASYGPAKCWPIEKYRDLGRKLLEDERVRVVIFGGRDQTDVSDRLEKALGPGAINLGGKTDLKQLKAMIERCTVMVSNDTGPMHIAAGLGVRTVALFGSTDPAKTAPPTNTDVIYHKQECSPCYRRRCDRGLPCMEAISVDQVYEKVREHL